MQNGHFFPKFNFINLKLQVIISLKEIGSYLVNSNNAFSPADGIYDIKLPPQILYSNV